MWLLCTAMDLLYALLYRQCSTYFLCPVIMYILIVRHWPKVDTRWKKFYFLNFCFSNKYFTSWVWEVAQCKSIQVSWSVIGKSMIRASSLLFALTMLTIHFFPSPLTLLTILSLSVFLLTCSNQSRQLVQQRPCHMISCLCDNACKRYFSI